MGAFNSSCLQLEDAQCWGYTWMHLQVLAFSQSQQGQAKTFLTTLLMAKDSAHTCLWKHTYAGLLGTMALFLPGCHFVTRYIRASWSQRITTFSDNFLGTGNLFLFHTALEVEIRVSILHWGKGISENLLPQTSLLKIIFWSVPSLCRTRQPP